MRVALWPGDLNGCGSYRMIWPAAALAAEGLDVTVIPPDTVPWATWDADTREPVSVEWDVVVVQRPLARARLAVIERLQQLGCAVVVEIDDDFARIHPANVAWHGSHPRLSPEHNWDILRQACKVADLVVCTTPALAERYGSHGRHVVVPNCVPARYLDVQPEPHEGVFVGWTGSIGTHPRDLHAAGLGVQRALERTGASFAVVGTGKGVQQALGLRQAPFAVGWVPLDDYPDAMAQLDVGIVPLERSPFNEAKSWLKGMEMAAVGVPFVASPTSPYCALHDEGAGLLADRPRDWEHMVRLLAGSETLREDIMLAGRQVAARWTIEGNAWRWWEAWTSAATMRRAA